MKKHIISTDATLLEALEALNRLSGDVMTLLAVDADGRMAGTLTDGDVRRALLNGHGLDEPVSAGMFRAFRSLSLPLDPEAIHRARRTGISLLPVLDAQGHIIKIMDLTERHTALPLRAVLMAGGRGERLRPLTDKQPKPLLPVGDRPIIDLNVDALRRCGVEDITVTTRYLAEQLEEHFADSEVRCLREELPLGTIGACSMLPKEPGVTLLMNSDLLTTLDYEEFYLHHRRQGNAITIATVSHTVSIPFAILTTEGDQVTGIEEKPTYTHYANGGIYLIDNDLLNDLPMERLDAPDFVAEAIRSGAKVGHFPITGLWMDIGTPADYKQANELFKLMKTPV